MKSRFRRLIAVLGVFALVASLTTVLLGSTVASAAPQTYQCINSFQPTGPTIPVTMDVTGNAAPNPTVIPGQTTVSGMTLTGAFPGSQVQLGLNGGAIAAGDPLPITATMTVAGTNVAEAAQATTTQTDPTPVITVTGGVANDIPFSITFPDNLAFTPTSAGTSNFTVTQIDLSTKIGVIPFAMPDCVTSPPHSVGSVTVNAPPAPPAPPVANNDTVTVAAGGTAAINVLANDTDPNGDIAPATVTVSTPASEGTATANADGTITYVNNGSSATTDTFQYTVNDAGGNGPSNPATVTVTVEQPAPPGAPVAADDSATVDASGTATIDVLANDADADGDIDPATVTVVSAPTAGTATVNADGTITYENVDDSATADTFTYTVDDQGGNGPSNAATVSITITPAPVVGHGSATNANACQSNFDSSYSSYDVTIASDAFPVPHRGQVIDLTATTVTLSFPGEYLKLGYNTDVVKNGDALPISVDLSIQGIGTTEGTHTYPTQTTNLIVSVTDPDGIPGNGNESAADVPVTLDLPDTTWTPTSGTTDVFFFQKSFAYSTSIGGIPLSYTCEVGTPVDTDGNGTNDSYTPATITPFLAVGAVGEAGTPPDVKGESVTSGSAGDPVVAAATATLAFTGNRDVFWRTLGASVMIALGLILVLGTKPAMARRLQRKQ